MYGLGTIINVAAIVVGGLLGMLFGRFIGERQLSQNERSDYGNYLFKYTYLR